MPIYVNFNGQTLSSVLNSFLLLHANAKIDFLKEKMVLRVVF